MWWVVAYLAMGMLTAEAGMRAILRADRSDRAMVYLITVTAWWVMVVYAVVVKWRKV